ncbi:tyrosine phosphatase family-domain-containing protein, partial [Kalaharituber pfeilii]
PSSLLLHGRRRRLPLRLPSPHQPPFLTLLSLRTLIYLSDTPLLPPTQAWASTLTPPLTIHHFPVAPVKEPFVENDPVCMRNALLILLDKRNHPVLIHSNKGKHRAGVLVACMRKILMGWSLAATFAEYGRYAGEKGEADLEFIELFSPELTFDKRYAPSWLRVKYRETTPKEIASIPPMLSLPSVPLAELKDQTQDGNGGEEGVKASPHASHDSSFDFPPS